MAVKYLRMLAKYLYGKSILRDTIMANDELEKYMRSIHAKYLYREITLWDTLMADIED